MELLNIITPCSRPQNLHRISESINIPRDRYRWIVVYDGFELPSKELIPSNCEIHCYHDDQSVVGHQQRNYAMNIITKGHIYSNDDDTLIHSQLWENIKDLENDLITFNQVFADYSPRLIDQVVQVCHVDSHNFIFSKELSDGLSFVNLYEGDGIFANECYNRSKSYIHIPKVLSVYNALR